MCRGLLICALVWGLCGLLVWGSERGYGFRCPRLVDRSSCIVSPGNCLGRFLHSLVRVLKSVRGIAFGLVVVGMR